MYENIDDYNIDKQRKITIIFDDMIAEKLPNRVTELFIRGRKLNISVIFITQSYFKTPKDIRLNATHYFLMKIPKGRELQMIANNHSADVEFNEFLRLYKKFTRGAHDFMVVDNTLPSGHDSRFRQNLMSNENNISK